MNYFIGPFQTDDYNIAQLTGLMFPEFCRIFGKEAMNHATCIIYNDPNSECPMHITNFEVRLIRLHQKKTSYWAQTIYQLSHEMCHYAIMYGKYNKDTYIKWLEETMCEAFSYYMLEYCGINWNKCELAKNNPSFKISIIQYLNEELEIKPNNLFILCNSVEKLRQYDRIAEKDRETRRRERKMLYEAIRIEPTEAAAFMDYELYINPDTGITINWNRWIQDSKLNIIRVMRDIQPVKEEQEVELAVNY